MALVVETPDATTAATIADAFRAPAYPLTAGPSDALLKAVAVWIEDAEPVATRVLAHVMVFREISPKFELYESPLDIPFHRAIRAGHQTASGRVRVRAGRAPATHRRDIVSFVADAIKLAEDDEAVVGYCVNPESQILRRSQTFSSWKDGLRGPSPCIVTTRPQRGRKTPQRAIAKRKDEEQEEQSYWQHVTAVYDAWCGLIVEHTP